MLVAFALSGVSPAATSAGKVSSVPPPAIALTNPARSAAAAPIRSWDGETGAGGSTIGRGSRACQAMPDGARACSVRGTLRDGGLTGHLRAMPESGTREYISRADERALSDT